MQVQVSKCTCLRVSKCMYDAGMDRQVEVGVANFDKKVMGRVFQKRATQMYVKLLAMPTRVLVLRVSERCQMHVHYKRYKEVEEALDQDVKLAKTLDAQLTADGKATFNSSEGDVELTRDMLTITTATKNVVVQK